METSTALVEDDISVLATPYVPNPEEACAIRARIQARLDEILRIDGIIVGFEATLGTLRTRRETLQQLCVVGNALLAPVRRLPEEILAEIFVQSIPWSYSHDAFKTSHTVNPNVPHPHKVRRHLTQVCRRWRSIVYRTPRIWSTLAFHRPLPSDLSTTQSIILQWLNNSKSCPLDVFVSPDRLFDSWDKDNSSRAVVQLIGREMRRFRHFVGRSWRADDLALLIPQGTCMNAPVLKTFSLGPISLEQMVGIGQMHTPQLETLSLWGVHALDIFTPAPFLTLRRLECWDSGVPSDTFLHYFSKFPQLEVLHLRDRGLGERNADTSSRPDNRVPLLSLREFVFTAHHFNQENRFSDLTYLRCLHVPNLETIDFTALGASPPDGEASAFCIVDSLLGSVLSLRHLTLGGITLSQDSIPSFWHRLPDLHTLCIHTCALDKATFNALMPRPSGSSLAWACPQLTKLELINVDLPGDDLIRLLRARTRAKSHGQLPGYLEFVNMRRCRGLESHHVIELRELAQTRADGILIQVSK